MKNATLSANQRSGGSGMRIPFQPPKNRMTERTDTRSTMTYSLTMKSAKRIPLYSVWNPAPRSPSASARSKGMRCASANPATKKTKNPIG
ncbi:hypothetical protein D3C71_2024960 [compost metagenome]